MLTDTGVVGVFLLRVMTECLKLSTYRAHRRRCSWCVSTESDTECLKLSTYRAHRRRCSWCVSTESDDRMFKTEYLPCSQTQV